MTSKTLDEYTTEDLTAWVDTLNSGEHNIPEGMRKTIKKIITDFSLDGSCLDVDSKEELVDVGFKKYLTSKLFSALQLIPKTRSTPTQGLSTQSNTQPKKPAKNVNSMDDMLRNMAQQRKNRSSGTNTNTNNDNKDKFKVQFFYSQKSRTTVDFFTSQSTVKSLQDHIIATEIGGAKKKIELLVLGKILKPEQTFKQVGLTAWSEVHVSFKSRGGATLVEDEKSEYYDPNERERIPDFESEKRIKPTFEPDCIMGYDDKNTIRVKMPCGHVFDPLTLFRIVKMSLEVHKHSEISCPNLDCETKWDFNVVAAACDLDETECRNFSRILSNRRAMLTGERRKCEGCGCFVSRPKEVQIKRIHCTNDQCTRGDFCWLCGGLWKGGGFIVCGNNDCHTAKINEALKDAKDVIPTYRKDKKKCPDLRACPRCYVLIRYTEACKHMDCWNCQKSFCFMCLALKDDKGQWGCIVGDGSANSPSGQCEVASKQVLK